MRIERLIKRKSHPGGDVKHGMVYPKSIAHLQSGEFMASQTMLKRPSWIGIPDPKH